MLNCTLEELPVGGVVWTLVVFGFMIVATAIAIIAIRMNNKK